MADADVITAKQAYLRVAETTLGTYTAASLVTNFRAVPLVRWTNVRLIDDSYTDIFVGESYNVSFIISLSKAQSLYDMFSRKVAVNFELTADNVTMTFRSGRIDSMPSSASGQMPVSVAYHANDWSVVYA